MEAPNRLEFEVTQEDIDNGNQEDCRYCAISLAVKRTYSTKFVETAHVVDVRINRDWYSYKLTEKAEDFIRDFDYDKKDVKPQKFSLYLWK